MAGSGMKIGIDAVGRDRAPATATGNRQHEAVLSRCRRKGGTHRIQTCADPAIRTNTRRTWNVVETVDRIRAVADREAGLQTDRSDTRRILRKAAAEGVIQQTVTATHDHWTAFA